MRKIVARIMVNRKVAFAAFIYVRVANVNDGYWNQKQGLLHGIFEDLRREVDVFD